MLNSYYSASIEGFLQNSWEEIIGKMTISSVKIDQDTMINTWKEQIFILKEQISEFSGQIFFEFSIPRMGKRIDCLLIISDVVFILEFKVGAKQFLSHDINQTWDYALDLKNFHHPSHEIIIIPVLIATEAKCTNIDFILHEDKLSNPLKTNKRGIKEIIKKAIAIFPNKLKIDVENFAKGSYSPTPTIIEAAIKLYNHHNVTDITRNDASAINLTHTTNSISNIIENAKLNYKKAICFVTGVPGAGKTLVGLNIASKQQERNSCIFLSGNGPLVEILQEALTRDNVKNQKGTDGSQKKKTKSTVKEETKTLIQNVHHYRDTYLIDPKPPYDHIAIFDEAQRAWNTEQTSDFMKRNKNHPNFNRSEPDYLISCLDRHNDWAVIVCLIGGGQEINKGESGISEWLKAIYTSYENWEVSISPNLLQSEYDAAESIQILKKKCKVIFDEKLHLSVSMRSYRAEKVSLFVKQLLNLNLNDAKKTYSEINRKYPIVITRSLENAKSWLKEKARGTERYGMVASSQALRLKPLSINVKSRINPINWFLDDENDVRSSYFLEDAATEFQIQGLELDWTCVVWDCDLRYSQKEWKTYSFVGSKWKRIIKAEKKTYLINAYRVLLTRARQGMVIVIPEGNENDATRLPEFYNPSYNYFLSIGLQSID